MIITSQSEDDTHRIARELAAELGPGDVLLLTGTLGAGKTTFVRGLAEGLGIAQDAVSSPTFTIVHEYRGGRVPLYHADLYRLEHTSTAELGLDEPAVQSAILVIEWPDRLLREPPASRRIELKVVSDDVRKIFL